MLRITIKKTGRYSIDITYCMHECSVAKLCFDSETPRTIDHQAPLQWISQAKTLECIAISFCRGSSPILGWIYVSCIDSCFFNVEPSGNILFCILIQDKSDILLVTITIGSNYMINRDKSDSVLWLNIFMLYNLLFISSSRHLPLTLEWKNNGHCFTLLFFNENKIFSF